MKNLSNIELFLEGKKKGLIEELRQQMQEASERLDFEMAASYASCHPSGKLGLMKHAVVWFAIGAACIVAFLVLIIVDFLS